MAINKVIYGNDTLIDLTSDTATEDKVLSGYIFHKASGEVAVGTASGGGDIPNGKTVTPTDDIQIWLHCAGIFDNEYTTLAEVLNDVTVYNALLSDSNACDYMARSTSWALAEGLVPVMTSNTTPSGVVSRSSVVDNTGTFESWKAFDRDDSTYWITLDVASAIVDYGDWIQYQFTEPTMVNKLSFIAGASYTVTKKYKIQGSNNGTDWTDLYNDTYTLNGSTSPTVHDKKTINACFNNSTAYTYYRVRYDSLYAHSVPYSINIYTIQFYPDADITTNQDAMRILGKYDYACEALLSVPVWAEAIANSEYYEYVLNTKVPTMTSNTTPSGECISSGMDGSYPEWKSFDGNNSTASYPSSRTTKDTYYLGYVFPSPIIVNKCKIYGSFSASYYADVAVYGGNDLSSLTKLSDVTRITTTTGTDHYLEFSNGNAYTYYVIKVENTNAPYIHLKNNYALNIAGLQFYGRTPINKTKYVPLVPTMTSNTTPSGVASADSEYNNAFHAFDYVWDSSNMGWIPANNSSGHWLKYEFPNPVLVKSFKIGSRYAATDVTFKLQGSNDDSTWDDLTDAISPTPSTSASSYKLVWSEYELEDNTIPYKYYRLYLLSGGIYNTSYGIKLQLYRLQEPEPAIIHCATDDEITIVGDDVERTIYAYGDTATLPSDIPSGLYTFTSAVLSNPSYPDQPYTHNVYITEHTTEIYFMPENMETVLWTNPAPTSAFASQTITLSDGISNYKYIKLKWKNINSEDQIGESIVPVDNFTSQSPSPNYNNFSGMFTTPSSYARGWVYVSDTQITFGNCYTLAGTTQNSNYCIPLEITGLNKLRTGKKSSKTTTTLWTNPNPTASAGFAAQNVTLSDDVSNYDYIEFEFFQNVSKRDDIVIVAFSPEQLKNKYIGSNWYGSSATIFAGNYYYTRYIRYDSETSMYISSGLKAKSGSSGSTFATSIIPNKIYGIKYE